MVFNCSKCQKKVNIDITQRPRGTRLVKMTSCPNCKKGLHIEGVIGIAPLKVIN